MHAMILALCLAAPAPVFRDKPPPPIVGHWSGTWQGAPCEFWFSRNGDYRANYGGTMYYGDWDRTDDILRIRETTGCYWFEHINPPIVLEKRL